MNQHLSSREISQWMMGERTPQQEQHVRQCPECGAEVTRMEAALALFRGSVRHWSDRQVRVPRPLAPTRGSGGYPAWPLASDLRPAEAAVTAPGLRPPN